MTVESNVSSRSVTRRGVKSDGPQVRRIPGESGIWIFIYGDLIVFGLLLCMYMVYRVRQYELFVAAQQTMMQDIGFANTLVLLASSLFVVIGVRSMRTDARRRAGLAFLAAIGCGVVFVVLKIVEWGTEVSAGLTPYTNDFYQLYYVVTGLHLVHVIVGIGVLAYLFNTARLQTIRPNRLAAAESGACFWHMVDLLWILIFPLFYLLL